MILLVLLCLVAPAAIVIFIVLMKSRNPQPYQPPLAPPPLPASSTVQERLLEIDALKAQGLISGTEHEEQRKKIIAGI